MSRREETTMNNNKRNQNGKPHKKNFYIPEFDIEAEIGDAIMIPTSDSPNSDSVSIPRYEYDNLIGKVAVYDLLRDMIARSDYINADSLRSLLGIAKRKEQAE